MSVSRRGVIRDSLFYPLGILVFGMFLVPMLVRQAGGALGRALGLPAGDPFVDFAVVTAALIVQGGVVIGLTLRRVLSAAGLGLPPEALGLRAADVRREVQVGLWWGVLLLAVNAAASRLSQLVFQRLMSEAEFQSQLEVEGARFAALVADGLPAGLIALFAFSSVVVAPLAEELFFRGYVLGVLRARDPANALFVSAFLFAFVHFYVIHFVPVFLIGLLLGALYERRGSLVAPIVAHGFSNLIVTASMVASGLLQRGM